MSARMCRQCGEPLSVDPTRPGRTPAYCSDVCRAQFNKANQIPESLRKFDRWVTWDVQTKAPLQVGGDPASVTDPRTWTSYARVRGLQQKGFVLGESIGCIDLDDCVSYSDSGLVFAPEVAEFVRLVLPQTYVEISPSARGLHVFGLMSPGPGQRFRLPNGVGVEVYSQERYITVTGLKVPGSSGRLNHIRRFLHLLPHRDAVPLG